MPTPDNDIAIANWNAMLSGSQEAFTKLMQEFYAELFRYGYSLHQDDDAVKDCIQNLFLNLWRTKGNLRPITNVKFYLLKSLRRELHKEVLRDSSQAEKQEQFLRVQDDQSYSREDLMISKEEQAQLVSRVTEGILTLSARQQEIIYLRFYMDMKPEEIAEIISLQRQSVYNLLSDALKRLKENIQLPVSGEKPAEKNF
ncbi:RNA polymerase sigma factor [Aridibaculum aurantiacum]|uniref:RNA polymerase sigma factor n=1 Tax=Aridibaculum aurantiacum TaxID=2810307 RepID=UPI001A977248|nr:sigma-70 family RNA polymerase sigma factor [Aridibaculum aurantiacum]